MSGIRKLKDVKKPVAKEPLPLDTKIVVLIGGKARKKTAAPKLVATAADNLYILRALRLAVQKVVDEIAAEEGVQREYLIENLPKSKLSGAIGRLACAKIELKTKPRVEDWPKFYAYIKKNNRFDLLQKRVSETAIQEMWDDKKVVPGTDKYQVATVSCTKK
jgi:hypothetical protein